MAPLSLSYLAFNGAVIDYTTSQYTGVAVGLLYHPLEDALSRLHWTRDYDVVAGGNCCSVTSVLMP